MLTLSHRDARNIISLRIYSFALFVFLLMGFSPSYSTDDNGDILDVIPAIIAGINAVPMPPVEGGSYANQKTALHISHSIRSEPFRSSTFALAIGYFDINGDMHDDIIISGGTGTTESTPIEIYTHNPNSNTFNLNYSFISGGVAAAPELVHPRKLLICKLNSDDKFDIIIIGHGYDRPPFPGESLVLLMSSPIGYKTVVRNDVSGFLHGGSCGDIDSDGDNDVFVTSNTTPFMLMNDGQGNLGNQAGRLPIELQSSQLYSAELIDVNSDGYFDLLVGGHEYDGMETSILWGNRSGYFSQSRRTVLDSGGSRWGVVLDFDVEDINGDGKNEIIVTRTGSPPFFYKGYRVQLLAFQNGTYLDVTNSKITLPEDLNGNWIDWIRVQDIDGDSDIDIFTDNADYGHVWLNSGQGTFIKQ